MEKKIKYIYIDDMIEEAQSIIKGFDTSSDFDITVQKPEELQILLKVIINNCSGVIVDQRLDQNTKYGKELRGTTIAQHLRTITSENFTIKSCPIILFTALKNKKGYIKDSTSLDLFDQVYLKEDASFEIMQKELIAFAEGYNQINISRDLCTLIGISPSDLDFIDYRLIHELHSRLNKDLPSHVFALFFNYEILKKSGILIDSNILAARLGIDKSKVEEWNLLRKNIEGVKYTGVFSKGFELWWSFKLENWWAINFPEALPLPELEAIERVDLINKKFNLKLKCAEKTFYSSSNMFWTVCAATQKPIDTIDGILINQKTPEPWQDEIYICIDELISESFKGIIWDEIHPSDLERAQDIKKANIKIRPK